MEFTFVDTAADSADTAPAAVTVPLSVTDEVNAKNEMFKTLSKTKQVLAKKHVLTIFCSSLQDGEDEEPSECVTCKNKVKLLEVAIVAKLTICAVIAVFIAQKQEIIIVATLRVFHHPLRVMKNLMNANSVMKNLILTN